MTKRSPGSRPTALMGRSLSSSSCENSPKLPSRFYALCDQTGSLSYYQDPQVTLICMLEPEAPFSIAVWSYTPDTVLLIRDLGKWRDSMGRSIQPKKTE